MAGDPVLLSLFDALDAPTIDLDRLERELDNADDAHRLNFVHLLTPKRQKRLFEAAEGRAVTLDAIVPPGAPPLSEVIHEGQNTLPAFNHFQKRFCSPGPQHEPSEGRRLWGYNHFSAGWLTGPGYFVAYEDEERGEVVIDYRELPPEKPEAWPEIISNKRKLGLFVYAGMQDRLRRVSAHVTIGRAYKSKPMNAWFALTRQG